MHAALPTISRRGALVGAAVTGSLLTAPALAQGATRVMRARPVSDLSVVDPLAAMSTLSLESAYLIFDCLYGMDADLVPRPQMVAGHDLSADQLSWRFTLRDGLFFHDGERVLARDATASITRWMQRNTLGIALKQRMAEMRVLDDRNFEIRLRRPFALLPFSLASNMLFVLPAHVAETTDAFTPVREFVGSGPFEFLRDEWQTGAYFAFRRNERYVPRQEPSSFMAGGKQAWLDRVEFHVIQDASTAAAALRKGEIDIMQEPPADLLDLLAASPGVVVDQVDPFGWMGMLVLNTSVPPMDNEKLRHALLVGMSQKDFMQAVVGDRPAMMRTGIGVFTPGTPLASPAGMEVLSDTPDLALARRLVRESGYDGTKIPFILQTDHERNFPLGQVGAQLMKDVGLNVDVQAMDNASAVRRRNSSQTSAAWAAYASDISGFNYSTPGTHYRLLATRPDPRIVALVDEWFDAPDLAGQKAAAERIQLRFFEAPPFLPLGEGFSPWAYRTGITDLVRSYIMLFWNVRKA